jgi:phosphinothricin acetyltransferase
MGEAVMSLRIRPAALADMPAVRAIYNHYVATSTCTFQIDPDTEEERRAWFLARTAAHPVTVAEVGGEVAGWAALSPWKPRGAYAHSVEASVYVRHDLHRRGIGRALMADLIDRARAAGHHTVLGVTCSEQAASVGLQESLGFQRAGCLRQVGHKFGRWLDVVYMQLPL